MTTASIGVRLSKQARDSNLSLTGMLDDCRALALQLGATVVAEHIDDGVSGSIRDRPGFIEWMNDGISGRADVLIAPHTDRVTREGVNVAAMVLDVVEGKAPGSVGPVRLVTVDGLDSNDEESFRWQFVIQAEIARSELKRITKRNRDTRRRLNDDGRWAGGPIPFGCRIREEVTFEGTKRRVAKYLEVEPAEAEIMNEAADKLIKGEAKRRVVRWLYDEGIKTRRGADWSIRQLKSNMLCEASRQHVFSARKYRALEKIFEPGKAVRGRPQSWLLSKGGLLCGGCGRPTTTAKQRYACERLNCPHQCTIDARAVDDFLEAEFLRKWGEHRWYETTIELVGGADIDQAEADLRDAQEALLARPGAETLASYTAAQEALAAAEASPPERRQVTRATDWTWAEWWADADIPERAAELRQALAEPVVLKPGTAVRRRVDLSRLQIVWRDEVE
jgi:site-specific DNA recombinase